jgi:hypothetical protein
MGNQSSRTRAHDELKDRDWGAELQRGEYQVYAAAIAAGVPALSVLDSRNENTGAHLLAACGNVEGLVAVSAAHVLQQEAKK